MKRIAKVMMIVGLMVIASHTSLGAASPSMSLRQGMPLPWPFPWAKDCKIDWSRMEGRYLLLDSGSEEIQLRVTVTEQNHQREVEIAYYAADGELLSQGTTFLNGWQRTIKVNLVPAVGGAAISRATLRFHYQSSDSTCAPDRLVPILTLVDLNDPLAQQVHYRLVRIGDEKQDQNLWSQLD